MKLRKYEGIPRNEMECYLTVWKGWIGLGYLSDGGVLSGCYLEMVHNMPRRLEPLNERLKHFGEGVGCRYGRMNRYVGTFKSKVAY
jgi:hypothetical protein